MKKIKIIDNFYDETYFINLTDEQMKLLDFLKNNSLLDDDVVIVDPEKEEYKLIQ